MKNPGFKCTIFTFIAFLLQLVFTLPKLKAQSTFFYNENFQIFKTLKTSDSLKIISKANYLKNKFLKKGYINAAIDTIEKTQNNYKVFFYIGNQYFWDTIKIINDSNTLIINRLHSKKANPANIKKLIDDQTTYLNNNGYPLANIYINNYSQNANKINLDIKIDKKNYIVFDSIYFDKRNVKVSPKYLQNYLGFKKNTPFNKSTINKIDTKIQNSNFLELNHPPEVEYHPGTCDLYLYLKNKKVNHFSGIIGFSNQKQKIALIGKIELGFGNFFGRGDYIFFKWFNTNNYGQYLNSKIKLPYIFNTKFGINENLEIRKNDTSYLFINNSFSTNYFFDGNDNISLIYNYTLSFPFSADTTYKQFSINYTGLSLTIDHRNDLFFTSKGFLFSFDLQAGIKKQKKTPIGRGINSFQTEKYIVLSKKLSILIRNYTKAIIGKNIAKNELLNFGGFESVRGFNQNEFFASKYSIFTTELRYLTNQKYILFSFADYCLYSTDEDFNLRNSKQLLGIGMGLSLKTKAGLLSIDYAIGKYHNNFDFNNSKLHFGIKTFF